MDEKVSVPDILNGMVENHSNAEEIWRNVSKLLANESTTSKVSNF